MTDEFDFLNDKNTNKPLGATAQTPDAKPAVDWDAKFKRHSMTELMKIPIPRWLIRDLLYERQIAVFYALSGSYKSFMALALLSMMTHDMEWQGRPLRQCRSLYLAGEGFPMFGLRRRAWFKHHRLEPADDGLEVINGTVNLLDDDEVAAFIRTCEGIDLDVLTIDTISASTAGGDENTSPVMSKAIKHVQDIGRTLDCASILIHHPGKDVERGLRGHSSLGGNVDAVWFGETIEDRKILMITTVKQKDGEFGKVFCFSVNRVALGIFDEDGVEYTSLALAPCETPADLKERRTDLGKVVSVLKFGEEPSCAMVAKRLIQYKLVESKQRAAETRVSKAVPVEWTPWQFNGKMVEIRRVAGENGKPHKLVMRPAEQQDQTSD